MKQFIKTILNNTMYIKFHKGKSVAKGRVFDYYKCSDFILLSLYFLHIRICKDKESYNNLPQAG